MWLHLYERFRIGKSTETGSRVEVTRVGGREEMERTTYGYWVSFWPEKQVLELDRDGGWTTL